MEESLAKCLRCSTFRGRNAVRGYVAYNYRDKMEASGWGSMTDKDVSTLTTEEKEEIFDRVQQENRELCRPRPSHVEDNAGRRTMSKLRLNALWANMFRAIPAATGCT
jgi:hypothetical protein